MSGASLATAHRLLLQAVDALGEAAGLGSDAELMSVLTLCEGATRRLDRVTVDALAALERRGVFAQRGYKSAAAALSDLLGWEGFEARRRVVAAEQVTPRAGLDGAVLPARLPATALVFADGRASLRHVEAIAPVVDAKARPLTGDDDRPAAQRQAEALADVCGYVLDHAPSAMLPECGGPRPHPPGAGPPAGLPKPAPG